MRKPAALDGFFESLVVLSLLLSTILQTYGWGKYDFSFIITSLLSVVYILRYGIRNTMPKLLLYYFFYRIAVHVICANGIAEMIPLGVLKMLLAYLMFWGIKDFNKLRKYYRLIAIVVITFFFVQEFTYHVIGHRISGIFTFLPMSFEDGLNLKEKLMDVSRSSSFFSEPAHLAQFLLPLFCIELFAKHKSTFYIIMTGITLLLTFSGNAIVGLAMVGVAYVFSLMKRRNNAVKLKMALFVVPAILGILYVYISSEMGQEMMSRSETLSSDYVNSGGASRSAYLRIYRGFAVYEQYGTIEKVLGNDNNHYFFSKAMSSSAAMFFEDENDNYLNTLQSFLLYTGLVGIIFFVLIFREIWKKSSEGGRVSLLVFYALSIVSALYLTDTMALYLVVAMLMPNEIENKQKNI